ncbi:hypothetical protein [Deinococcus sp. QL22]|uniref:hypothetical protein n=1 Tax=Deinococcus sp. QL22 TaxID=2939437 RepID=UPI0020170426|nr:hypothetical protein [Deinococcus sp. QL22]UQN06480.1 hypothetical protein M1R55_00755 [Deinococcus sp. QL22]
MPLFPLGPAFGGGLPLRRAEMCACRAQAQGHTGSLRHGVFRLQLESRTGSPDVAQLGGAGRPQGQRVLKGVRPDELVGPAFFEDLKQGALKGGD